MISMKPVEVLNMETIQALNVERLCNSEEPLNTELTPYNGDTSNEEMSSDPVSNEESFEVPTVNGDDISHEESEEIPKSDYFEEMVVDPIETIIQGPLETVHEDLDKQNEPVGNPNEGPLDTKLIQEPVVHEDVISKQLIAEPEKTAEDPLKTALNFEISIKQEDLSQDSLYQMNQEVTDEIVIENVTMEEASPFSSPIKTEDDFDVKPNQTPRRKRKRSQLDQLLDNSKEKTPKRPKNDIVELPKLKGNGDIFCWTCHRPGPFMAVCTICRRIYHATKCSNLNRIVPENWVCYECKAIEEEKVQAHLQSCSFDPESLNSLLMMVTEKLENAKDAGPFKTSVDPIKYPDYTEYVHTPMNLFEMKKKISRNAYENIYSYILDLKTIVHNSYIYNTAISGLTFTARSLLRKGVAFIQDMRQCPECFIHAFLCNKKGFVEACTQVHMPVWAKFKGYPFWPAKLMKLVEPDELDNETFVQVKFFGDHNRANVSTSNVYLLSEKTPTKWIPKHCSMSFKDASEEMNVYICNLEMKFSKFVFAPPFTKFDPNVDLAKQIRVMLPAYPVNQVTKAGDLKIMQKVNLMRKKTYEKNEESKAMGVLFARLSDQSPEEFGLSRIKVSSRTNCTKTGSNATSNQNTMLSKNLKKLSKAEIEALRLNERKKMNGLLTPKEVHAQKQLMMAKKANAIRQFADVQFRTKDFLNNPKQFVLPNVENAQHSIKFKNMEVLKNCLQKEDKALIKEAFPNLKENSLVQLIRVQKPIRPTNQFSIEKSLMHGIKILNPNLLEKAQRPLNLAKKVEFGDKAPRILQIRTPNATETALQHPIQFIKPISPQKDSQIQPQLRNAFEKPQQQLIQLIKPVDTLKPTLFNGNAVGNSKLNQPKKLTSFEKEQIHIIRNENSMVQIGPKFNRYLQNCKTLKKILPVKIGNKNAAEIPQPAVQLRTNSQTSPTLKKIISPKSPSKSLIERPHSVEKTERSPTLTNGPNSHEKAPIAEIKQDSEEVKPSENKTVIAVRRDLFVTDRNEQKPPPQAPIEFNFGIKRTVKKFEKRPITLEEFTRVLNQGQTLEQVIHIACKGLESLKSHYTEKTINLTNDCAIQIQALDEDKVKIAKMVDQRFSDKLKRMEKINDAQVKKLKVLYDDRIKQVKLRQWCGICKRTANLYCCYKSYYCSLSCQDLDWPKHIDKCQQHKMVASDPNISLNPNHRNLIDKEEDDTEDKKDFLETLASIRTATSPTKPGNYNNLNNKPIQVPVLSNHDAGIKCNNAAIISPLPTQISTLLSVNSDSQIPENSIPIIPPYPKMIGGKRLKLILPKPPNV